MRIRFPGSAACLAAVIVSLATWGLPTGKRQNCGASTKRSMREWQSFRVGRDTRQLTEYHQSINFYQVSEKAY